MARSGTAGSHGNSAFNFLRNCLSSKSSAAFHSSGGSYEDDPLEEEMAPHSSILAWRIPWTEEAWWAAVCGVAESDRTEPPSLSTVRKPSWVMQVAWALGTWR